MAKDDDLIEKLKKQIHLLNNLENAVTDAIGRANRKLEELRRGEPIEKVFAVSPKK
jgi:hypothetical protein